jgi:2-polyprenyl-3-methyl-5-hydroxy-6-metoxy-1,4-benzoquinol methylase
MINIPRKISGEILARILAKLQNINATYIQDYQIEKAISEEFEKVESIFCDIVPREKVAVGKYDYKRVACFDDDSFSKLDVMLPWSSYFYVDDVHSIGTPWSSRKRAEAQPFPDPTVAKLNTILPLKGLSILEVGCYEGHHTASLALHSNDVWAIDGRIENVIKTLVRTWLSNCERNVTINLVDLETNNLSVALAQLGRTKPFDLIHHRGVLYHLSHPILHLRQCATICDKHLYLHTQIASDENANRDITIDGISYRIFEYKEPKIDVSPFSGITNYAYWLTKDSLLKALSDVGFTHVKIINLKNERNGPRIELLASK